MSTRTKRCVKHITIILSLNDCRERSERQVSLWPHSQIPPRQKRACQAHQGSSCQMIKNLLSRAVMVTFMVYTALPRPPFLASMQTMVFLLNNFFHICLVGTILIWFWLLFCVLWGLFCFFSHLVILIRLEYFSSIVTFHYLGQPLQRAAPIDQGRLHYGSQIGICKPWWRWDYTPWICSLAMWLCSGQWRVSGSNTCCY